MNVLTKSLVAATIGAMTIGLAASDVRAEIATFSVQSIDGVGVSLNKSRFSNSADQLYVNIEDCAAYTGKKAEFTVSSGFATTAGYQYSVAYTGPGGSCDVSDLDLSPDEDTQCYVAAEQEDLSGNVTFEVELSKLMGTDCNTGSQEDSSIYFLVELSGVTGSLQTQETVVEIDLKAPPIPTIKEIEPGDTRLNVKWTLDEAEDDDCTYNVYWDIVDFAESAIDTVNRKTGIDGQSFQIETNIDNGVRTYVRVAAVDNAGNRGSLSTTEDAIPEETYDFWEAYQLAGGTDPGGFCFIATAAYGTPMAAQLDTLRSFRDRILLPTVAGRAFVELYYRWGRFAAAWIADSPTARAAVRVALVPLVGVAWLTTSHSVPVAIVVLLTFLAAAFALRRRWVDHILREVPVEVR